MTVKIELEGKDTINVDINSKINVRLNIEGYINAVKANSLPAYLTACELSFTEDELNNLYVVHEILEGDISPLEGSVEVVLIDADTVRYTDNAKFSLSLYRSDYKLEGELYSCDPLGSQISSRRVMLLPTCSRFAYGNIYVPVLYKGVPSFTNYIDFTCNEGALFEFQQYIVDVYRELCTQRGVSVPDFIAKLPLNYQLHDGVASPLFTDVAVNSLDIALNLEMEYVENLRKKYFVYAIRRDCFDITVTTQVSGEKQAKGALYYTGGVTFSGECKTVEEVEKFEELNKTTLPTHLILLVSSPNGNEFRLLY